MKSWIEKNDIEMYSAHNEGKPVIAERFIRTLKNKIYKYMSSISKNAYIDKLDGIVNKYYNTHLRTTKTKPADVKSSICINSSKEISYEDPKFKIGDTVRISKCKNMFAKGYVPNWSEEVLAIKKVQNTVPWTHVISDLKGEEIVETFYEKELRNTRQKEFRVEKQIKRNGDKQYIKWKEYDSSFDSWIDKKDMGINEWTFFRTKILRKKSESWIRYV